MDTLRQETSRLQLHVYKLVMQEADVALASLAGAYDAPHGASFYRQRFCVVHESVFYLTRARDEQGTPGGAVVRTKGQADFDKDVLVNAYLYK